MKRLLPLLALAFASCIQGTTVWNSKSQRILATNGDYAVMNFRQGNTSLSAVALTHSSLITARGKAFEGVIEKAGTAMGQGGRAFVKP